MDGGDRSRPGRTGWRQRKGVGFGRWGGEGARRRCRRTWLSCLPPPAGAARRLSAPASPPPEGSNAHLPGMFSPHPHSNRDTEQLGPCPDGRRCPWIRALATTRCKVKTQGLYNTRRLSRRETFGPPTYAGGQGGVLRALAVVNPAAVDLGKKHLVQTLLWIHPQKWNQICDSSANKGRGQAFVAQASDNAGGGGVCGQRNGQGGTPLSSPIT